MNYLMHLFLSGSEPEVLVEGGAELVEKGESLLPAIRRFQDNGGAGLHN